MGCEWNRGQLLEDVGFEGKEAVAGGWTVWEAESFLRRGGGAGAALEGGCSPGHRGPGGVLPHILVSWRRGSSVTVLQTRKLAQTIGGRERI